MRFTTAGPDRGLIGPGTGCRSTWIDLIISDTDGFDAGDLEQRYGDHFHDSRELIAQHDPEGTLSNEFTRRILGHQTVVADDRAA